MATPFKDDFQEAAIKVNQLFNSKERSEIKKQAWIRFETAHLPQDTYRLPEKSNLNCALFLRFYFACLLEKYLNKLDQDGFFTSTVIDFRDQKADIVLRSEHRPTVRIAFSLFHDPNPIQLYTRYLKGLDNKSYPVRLIPLFDPVSVFNYFCEASRASLPFANHLLIYVPKFREKATYSTFTAPQIWIQHFRLDTFFVEPVDGEDSPPVACIRVDRFFTTYALDTQLKLCTAHKRPDRKRKKIIFY